MDHGLHTEVATAEFARSFATRLRDERHRSRRPLRWLAARGHGRFSTRDLRDAEDGLLPLDAETVGAIASIYGVDVPSLISHSSRSDLSIAGGVLSGGGISVPFDEGSTASLVAAYFRLTRTLRALDDHDPTPVPRRADVQVLIEHVTATPPSAETIEMVLRLAEGDRMVTVAATRNALACAGVIDAHSSVGR
jgi:hypothetical protein